MKLVHALPMFGMAALCGGLGFMFVLLSKESMFLGCAILSRD